MNRVRRFSWISFCIATVCGVAVTAWLLLVVKSPIPMKYRDPSPGFGWSWDSDYQRAMREPSPTLDSPISQRAERYRGEIILPLDQPVSIANLELTYRGPTGSGKFRLDVIIPALDPEYAYPNILGGSAGGKSFSLYGQRFKISAVGKYVLRLKLLAPE